MEESNRKLEQEVENEKQNIERINELLSEINEKDTVGTKMSEENEDIEKQVTKIKDEIAKLEDEETRVNKMKEETHNLKNELRRLQGRNDDLEEKQRGLERESTSKQNKTTNTNNEREDRSLSRDRRKDMTSRDRRTETNTNNREDERKIFDLERKLKNKKSEYEEVSTKSNNDMKNFIDEIKQTKEQLKTKKQRKQELTTMIAQQIEKHEKLVEVSTEKNNYHSERIAKINDELSRITDLQTKIEIEETDLQVEFDTVNNALNSTQTKGDRLDTDVRQKEKVLERLDRDMQDKLKQFRDIKEKYTDVEISRSQTQLDLDILNETFRITREDLESEKHTLELEIHDTTVIKEDNIVKTAELEKEFQDFRWYVKDVDEQQEDVLKHSIDAYDFITSLKREKMERIKRIDNTIIDYTPNALMTLDELTKKFTADVEYLTKNNPTQLAKLRSELKPILEALVSDKEIEVSSYTKIFIVSTVLDRDHNMYPGAVRELMENLVDVIEGRLSPVFLTDKILKYAYRDFKEINDPSSVSYRRCLLRRLVKLKKKKSKKQACNAKISF